MEGSSAFLEDNRNQPHTLAPESQTPKKLQLTKKASTNNPARLQFWLTEAQVLYIQHKLPHLYSLIPAKAASSRLITSSKALEQQSAQFVSKRRGRPEGSFKKTSSKNELNQRKSLRILSKRKRKSPKQNESENQNQSSSEYSNSLSDQLSQYKEFTFEKSISRFDLRSEKSREFKNYISPSQKEVQEDQKNKKEETESKHLFVSPQTAEYHSIQASREQKIKESKQIDQSEQQSILASKSKSSELGQKKKAKSKGKEEEEKVKLKKQSKKDSTEKQFNLSKFSGDRQEKKEQEQSIQQNKPHIAPLNQKIQAKTMMKQVKQNYSEELQSKFIQEKFGLEIDILKKLKAHESILPFLQPVDEDRDGAPGYYKAIDDPIDLQTIEFKLANNIYKQPLYFHNDVEKMWSNAKQYNSKNAFMLQTTSKLQRYYFKLKKAGLQSKSKKESKRVEE